MFLLKNCVIISYNIIGEENMDQLLFLVIGFLINTFMSYYVGKLLKNFNLPKWLFNHLPESISGILGIVLGVIVFPLSAIILLGFGSLIYNAIENSNMILLIQFILLDIICIFLFNIIVDDRKY